MKAPSLTYDPADPAELTTVRASAEMMTALNRFHAAGGYDMAMAVATGYVGALATWMDLATGRPLPESSALKSSEDRP